MNYELILLVLIVIYGLLALGLVKGGYNMFKKKSQTRWLSPHQRRVLEEVKYNKERYNWLYKYYMALNAEIRRGRVLDLYGNVLDEGEIIKKQTK